MDIHIQTLRKQPSVSYCSDFHLQEKTNATEILSVDFKIIEGENQTIQIKTKTKTKMKAYSIGEDFLQSTVLNPNDVNQFKRKLGFTRNDSPKLRDIIMKATEKEEPIFQKRTRWNDRYILNFQYQNVVIKTVWAKENNQLRLISCKVA